MDATDSRSSVICWSLYNIEGDDTLSAQYVTYASPADMLVAGVFTPNETLAGRDIVGSGSAFVSSNGTVPEPGTLALLGLGLAGVAVSRRRKQ